jgi:hypothetical protein
MALSCQSDTRCRTCQFKEGGLSSNLSRVGIHRFALPDIDSSQMFFTTHLGGPMKNALTAIALALLALASPAQGAPVREKSHLPFSKENIKELMAPPYKYTAEQVKEFTYILWEIEVFEDHANPKDANQRHNERARKIYYGAPFLTPSAARSTVGAEQFADYALTAIQSIDTLMLTFDIQGRELERIDELMHSLSTRMVRLKKELDKPKVDPVTRASLERQLRPSPDGVRGLCPAEEGHHGGGQGGCRSTAGLPPAANHRPHHPEDGAGRGRPNRQ